MPDFNGFSSQVTEHLKSFIVKSKIAHGELTLIVRPDDLLAVATLLKDCFRFEQLMDVCGVDYKDYGVSDWQTHPTGFSRGIDEGVEHVRAAHSARFSVVYHLLSQTNNQRLRLIVYIEDGAAVPSVCDIWASANWFERETFDLFGIPFTDHPDLRRILTDYGFVGHPFRKDFPLSGHVEMRYDAAQQRVVYEPVDIKPRTLVPKVIRQDNRYQPVTSPPDRPAKKAFSDD